MIIYGGYLELTRYPAGYWKCQDILHYRILKISRYSALPDIWSNITNNMFTTILLTFIKIKDQVDNFALICSSQFCHLTFYKEAISYGFMAHSLVFMGVYWILIDFRELSCGHCLLLMFVNLIINPIWSYRSFKEFLQKGNII